MKKLLTIIPLVIVLCFTFSCQQVEEVAEEAVVDVEADIEAIENLNNHRMKAFNKGNLEAFMAIIADDAVFMPPDEPALIGKDEIRNSTSFDEISFDVTIFSDEIEISGEWAFQRVHWKGSWILKESGVTTPFESKEMFIYRKQPDGSWKTSHAIWNNTKMKTNEK